MNHHKFQWLKTTSIYYLQFCTSRDEKLSVDQNQKPRYWQSYASSFGSRGKSLSLSCPASRAAVLGSGALLPSSKPASPDLSLSLCFPITSRLLPNLLLSPSYRHPYFYLRPNWISQNNLPLSKSSMWPFLQNPFGYIR